jgi:hypothetical protein
MKHQEVHPGLDVDGCFGCRISHVRIAPSAAPSRGRGALVADTNRKDKVLDKDLDAYKRLRQEGLQPKAINGSAAAESQANYSWQVETGLGM